jgi:hypothetical protein
MLVYVHLLLDCPYRRVCRNAELPGSRKQAMFNNAMLYIHCGAEPLKSFEVFEFPAYHLTVNPRIARIPSRVIIYFRAIIIYSKKHQL